MASKDKITQKDVIDSSVVDEFKDLNSELEKTITLMSALTKESADFFKTFKPEVINDVVASQKAYNDSVEKSQEVNKKAITTAEKLKQKTESLTKSNERARIGLQKKRKEIRDSIKAEKAQAGSINDLNAKNKILRERVKNVSTATKIGTKRIANMNKMIAINEQRIDSASDAYTKQKRNIGKYQTALKGLGSALGIVTGGLALAAAAIRKGIQITKQAVEVNRTFEKTFTNVLTLLDKAEKAEFGVKLERGAVDLIANYGLEIEDTNKALFDTISAGVDAGDSIEFLNKASRLAIAGNAELTDVVDGATNIMNAYGNQVKNVDDVFNSFFAAQVEGKTTVGELASSIGKVAPIAASVDFGMNELLGTTALLTKQIGSTDEATTVLRQVMAAVIKPSTDAAKTFDKLGISYGATAIKQEGFLNIFKQVTGAADDNQDVLAELIPNIRALTGASALGEEQFIELEAIISELNDTELSTTKVQEAFNEQMNTGAKQTEKMSGSYKRMLIAVGGGESIFKRIGTSIRSELTEKFDFVSKNIEVFRVTWSSQMELIELAWQRVTGELNKNEFRDAIKKNTEDAAKSLISIAKRYGDINKIIEENTELVTDNNEAAEESVAVTEIQIKTIADLNAEIAELQKSKALLSVTDLKGIESTNIQIKAIQDQIKALNELGIKEEEIVKIKEKADEDILSEIEKQSEKELELLFKKLEDEHEAELESLEEFEARKQEIRETEAQDKLDKIEEEKAARQEYINFAINAAGQLSNDIFGFLDAQTDAQLASDIEKAKSRGASVKEIEKLEKDAAKKKQKRAIVEAIINTALAVTAALANPGGILGIVIAALAAVSGALSIATISSQSFAKGTKDSGSEGMIAEVGEAGTERINYADGTSALTPNGSTYTYLPPHSEVVPNRILQQDLAQMQAAGRSSSSKEEDQRKRLEHNELMKALRNKPETYININENGFNVIARKGNDRTSYIDRVYRHKK